MLKSEAKPWRVAPGRDRKLMAKNRRFGRCAKTDVRRLGSDSIVGEGFVDSVKGALLYNRISSTQPARNSSLFSRTMLKSKLRCYAEKLLPIASRLFANGSL